MGLIAQEFIAAGTTVWSFMPGFDVRISEATLTQLSPAAKEQLLYYAYFHEKSGTLVLSSDDDRFTNHSDNPNTRIINDDVVAIRDIDPGEEITADYRELTVFHFPPPAQIPAIFAESLRDIAHLIR